MFPFSVFQFLLCYLYFLSFLSYSNQATSIYPPGAMLCHQINLPRPSSFWLIINPSPLFSLSTDINTPLSSLNRPTSSTHTTPFSIAYVRCSRRTKSLPYASTPLCSPTPQHLLPTFLQPSQPARPLLRI